MFHSSTQKEHWMFKDEEELGELRKKANLSFCAQQKSGAPILDPQEEFLLFRYYQKKLVELCNLFAPPKWVPLPKTALVSVCGDVLGVRVYGFILLDNCGHILQAFLPAHLSDGVSPTGYVVRIK